MKHLRFAVVTVFLMLTLTACSSGKDKDINVDINKLAEEVQSEAITSGELSKAASDIAASTYFWDADKIEENAAYLSAASTACEVAIVKCKDSSYVSEVETLFKNRAANQSKLYASYNAEGAAKLDSAIIKSAGNYVVLCVVDDTKKAESLLSDYGF